MAAGGSIAVTALLKGTGNPPGQLHLPEKKGVTWLEPEVRESVDADRPKISAVKKLTYVVSLSEPGGNDLGDHMTIHLHGDHGGFALESGQLDQLGLQPGLCR